MQFRAAATAGYHYSPDVLDDVPQGALVLLRGPCRVGKSVELKRFIQSTLAAGATPRAVIHAAVDGWKAPDLRTFVEAGKRLAPPDTPHRWWLIDEICTVKGWDSEIKNLRDNDSEFSTDTVILTGSNASDLTSATSSLAGRRGPVSRPDRILLPMGFRSFANIMIGARSQVQPSTPRLKPADVRTPHAAAVLNELLPWQNDLTAWWEVYLQCGGFPQAVSAQLAENDLDSVVQALFNVLQRDVFGRAELSEAQVGALLTRICENLTSPLNVSKVAEDVGVSPDTVTRRLDNLVAAYELGPCHVASKGKPLLKSHPKRYFTDPLLARLAHLRNGVNASPDSTQLSEQQLGMALLRATEALKPGTYAAFDQVLYERTPARKEIDFVGPGLGPAAIEGKYTDSGRWVGEAATVNASPYAGVLATRAVLDTSAVATDQAWAVPASFLAYCIDV